MKTRLLIVIAVFSLTTAGCATTWMTDEEPLAGQPQWPQGPEKGKVAYVTTVKGFKETGTSFSTVMRKIIFGRSPENRIVKPVAVVAGPDGSIAIADAEQRCVHLYLPKEQLYKRIFGSKSEALQSPVGLAFDEELNLYVSDSTLNKIFVFDRHGEAISSISTAGTLSLKRPTGLVYNPMSKLLYAVDTLANTVYAFKKDGTVAFSFGQRGIENGQFNYPTYIYLSSTGLIYITDSLNFRVQVFDAAGNHVSTFGHHGDGSGDFAMPKGVAADKDGIVYVADSLFDSLQLFTLEGSFLLAIGGQGSEKGQFWMPSGIFIDGNGRLYVCDTFNQRIQVFQIAENYHE